MGRKATRERMEQGDLAVDTRLQNKIGEKGAAQDGAEQDAREETQRAAEEIHISVRGLVEFILRHGDLDNRRQAAPDDAMQEGGRIHRKLQKRMGAEYQPEVSLKYVLPADNFVLVIEGRADGIIRRDGEVIIDEIKGTYGEVARMSKPRLLHLAQAKCYAYMYAQQQKLKRVRVRMTYCHLISEELRYFYEDYGFEELEKWFGELTAEYLKWADYSWKWQGVRQASIRGLCFPFPYREGQKELVVNIYKTIFHKKKLFIEAPTGVGKTISTIYPAVQAMGKGMGEKLFYLTAKTITRTVAEEALENLREKGLRFKSVILTAKEKICFMEETECNPEYCPYAKGHFDRINAAVFELLEREESFDRRIVEEYARRHCVCPFEMCLDVSLFADAVICDYNYLFDPHIYLKRFFGDGSEGKYIFLVDEAHNLLDRSREMYSAMLYGEEFLELSREIEQTVVSGKKGHGKNKGVSGQISLETMPFVTDASITGQDPEHQRRTIDQMSTDPAAYFQGREKGVAESCAGGASGGSGHGRRLIYLLERCDQELLELGGECGYYQFVDSVEALVQNLTRLQAAMDDYLSEPEDELAAMRDQVLELYFEVNHFLYIYDLLDDNYVKYSLTNEEGDCMVKLYCVNPAENLKKCMLRGRSTILFSATLLPIQYYKGLLGGEKEDYEVYAQSVFDPARRALLIAKDVTSKYTRRSGQEYFNIARYIEEIVKCRQGNYMVFCPSYAFLQAVYDTYTERFAGAGRECILQGEAMREAEREDFLSRFRRSSLESGDPGAPEEDGGEGEPAGARTLVGFCVLGGIFSEGIDLKNDSLIGAVIVGTGLPQVGGEREILKEYFGDSGENGFDYAYRYPGMNKVLQAAGRVIRTVDDAGVIALLDERFLQYTYRRLFPREWQSFQEVTVDTVAERVRSFWEKIK